MGKRITFLMLLTLLLLALTFAVGCSDGSDTDPSGDNGDATWQTSETQHWKNGGSKEDHTFGEWTVTEDASCKVTGSRKHTCSVCAYEAVETIPMTSHTFDTTKWKSDDTHHWNSTTCGCLTEKGNYAEHEFSGGACTVCKKEQPATAGIETEKVDGKDAAIVVSSPAGLKGTVVVPKESSDYVTVKEIGAYAFANQTGITDVIMPETVTTIHPYAFSGCTSLKTITIGNKVTEIGAYAFNGCTTLETVTFESTSRVKTIGARAFADCAKLAEVSLPDSVTSVGGSAFAGTKFADTPANYENGVLYSGKVLLRVDTTVVGSVSVKEGTKLIADRAFNDCADILSVTVPTGVRVGKNVYDGCDKLMNNASVVTVGDFDFMQKSGVYYLVAYNGTSATVTLPADVNGAEYVIGEYAFTGENITSVTIPAGVTAIGAHAFDGCAALTTVSMGDDIVSIGDYAFNGCVALTSAYIGAMVTEIGDNAYNGCLALTTLEIPNSVETIGARAFANCKALVTVKMGTGLVSVDEHAFYMCNEIDNLYVTDLAKWCGVEFADKEAHPFGYYNKSDSNKFYVGEDEVTALTLPTGVKRIGNYAFYNCDRITSLTVNDELVIIGYCAFQSYQNGGLTTVNCSTTGWRRGGANFTTGTSVEISVEEMKGNNAKFYHFIYGHTDY